MLHGQRGQVLLRGYIGGVLVILTEIVAESVDAKFQWLRIKMGGEGDIVSDSQITTPSLKLGNPIPLAVD